MLLKGSVSRFVFRSGYLSLFQPYRNIVIWKHGASLGSIITGFVACSFSACSFFTLVCSDVCVYNLFHINITLNFYMYLCKPKSIACS